jgi:hypothetical protein
MSSPGFFMWWTIIVLREQLGAAFERQADLPQRIDGHACRIDGVEAAIRPQRFNGPLDCGCGFLVVTVEGMFADHWRRLRLRRAGFNGALGVYALVRSILLPAGREPEGHWDMRVAETPPVIQLKP